MTNEQSSRETVLREQAIKRLKKRRDFKGQLLVYVLVNAFLVVLWATTSQGFFWPVVPMAIWGIFLVMGAWDVYSPDEFDEESINREIQHLENRR